MAKEYGIHPALLLGVDPIADSWLAYQIARATFKWGSYVDSLFAENARNRDQHGKPKPIHNIRQVLGLPFSEDDEDIAPLPPWVEMDIRERASTDAPPAAPAYFGSADPFAGHVSEAETGYKIVDILGIPEKDKVFNEPPN
jgi:hypothetical protein